MLKSDVVTKMLAEEAGDDRLVIAPLPDINKIATNGAASIDLRLGCWFATLRGTRLCALDIAGRDDFSSKEPALTKLHFVPFGKAFVLHPRSFVLGVTLQWLRLPQNIGGYVTSRSSWGRRGLIIATAVGVHPGFAGCLTLELSNVGELPIKLYPGMDVCQFFLHRAESETKGVNNKSRFIGKRRPLLGKIDVDGYFEKLTQLTPDIGRNLKEKDDQMSLPLSDKG
jgi:dCTP deaminase